MRSPHTQAINSPQVGEIQLHIGEEVAARRLLETYIFCVKAKRLEIVKRSREYGAVRLKVIVAVLQDAGTKQNKSKESILFSCLLTVQSTTVYCAECNDARLDLGDFALANLEWRMKSLQALTGQKGGRVDTTVHERTP